VSDLDFMFGGLWSCTLIESEGSIRIIKHSGNWCLKSVMYYCKQNSLTRNEFSWLLRFTAVNGLSTLYLVVIQMTGRVPLSPAADDFDNPKALICGLTWSHSSLIDQHNCRVEDRLVVSAHCCIQQPGIDLPQHTWSHSLFQYHLQTVHVHVWHLHLQWTLQWQCHSKNTLIYWWIDWSAQMVSFHVS